MTELRMASGMGGHCDQLAVRTRQRSTEPSRRRMGDATTVVLPEERYVHQFGARRSVDLEGSGSSTEATAPIRAAEGETVTARPAPLGRIARPSLTSL